jgi:hypothetical protein
MNQQPFRSTHVDKILEETVNHYTIDYKFQPIGDAFSQGIYNIGFCYQLFLFQKDRGYLRAGIQHRNAWPGK